MPNFLDKLKEAKDKQKSFKTNPNEVMTFLSVARRGWRVDEQIKELIDKYDLIAEPLFEETWKWGEVEVRPKPKISAGKAKETNNEVKEKENYDPTPRLSLLRAANLNNIKNEGEIGLISVNRNQKLNEATTLMFKHGFSQLPILAGVREVEGIISWRSIGKALSLGKICENVIDCKEEVTVLDSHVPLFEAVKIILEKEVVLVKQKDKTISGIVTANDIGEQFIALAEPFLIIEQIENHIRKLLDDKFDVTELQKAIDQTDKDRKINNLSDLTFGEYIRIIEVPNNFSRLNLNIDRTMLVKQLDDVRKIRNDVMHFDPEGVSESNLRLLRQTANFFYEISRIIL